MSGEDKDALVLVGVLVIVSLFLMPLWQAALFWGLAWWIARR